MLVGFALDTLIFKILRKLLVFEVINATFDVEGEWQSIVDVLAVTAISIIISHVYEKCFLVIEMLVEFQFVINLLHSLLALFKPQFQVYLWHWDSFCLV